MDPISTKNSKLEQNATLDQIIGQNIRHARKTKCLSQTDLAQKLGLTYQQVQKYESGKNRISASTLYRVCEILDISITNFFENLDPSAKRLYTTEEYRVLRLYSQISSDDLKRKITKMIESIIRER